jgi:hypothetical protein
MYQEKGFEFNGRKYIVSNNGKVFFGEDTLRAIYHQELTQYTTRDGYMAVTMGVATKRCRKCVHQLVAMCFLEKPNDGREYEVDHRDRNRTNNNVENLRYLTHSENVKLIPREIQSESKSGERNGRATFTWDEIDKIREWYKQGYTITEISKMVYGDDIPYKYKWNTISHIVKNETWIKDKDNM